MQWTNLCISNKQLMVSSVTWLFEKLLIHYVFVSNLSRLECNLSVTTKVYTVVTTLQ